MIQTVAWTDIGSPSDSGSLVGTPRTVSVRLAVERELDRVPLLQHRLRGVDQLLDRHLAPAPPTSRPAGRAAPGVGEVDPDHVVGVEAVDVDADHRRAVGPVAAVVRVVGPSR